MKLDNGENSSQPLLISGSIGESLTAFLGAFPINRQLIQQQFHTQLRLKWNKAFVEDEI